MNDEEMEVAHEASVMFQDLIVYMGATLLAPLNEEQREYVIYKASNEFRFWRVEGALKEAK